MAWPSSAHSAKYHSAKACTNRRDTFSRPSSGRRRAPLAAAIPEGTALRALYVTDRGDAFVDLTVTARTKHSGGALDELFTVYAIVDSLTVNLPAITRVQILLEGKEVDTLAGHVDLRHPLQKNLQWVRT